MSKPFAVAVISGQPVEIKRSRATGAVCSFHAPTWRAMCFRTVEAAKAKMERHPGFSRWAA